MNEELSFAKRFWGHLTTITQHIHMVHIHCFRMGLYKQGFLHDLSKFSPIEFWSGVKYYQGYRSPIDKEKELFGYSEGWLHHKGRNKHHWEYWIDRTFGEIKPVKMPFIYVCESVCDRLAACKIYQKDKYTDASALEYFMNGTDRKLMNQENVPEFERLLGYFKEYGEEEAFRMIKKELQQLR